MQKTNKLRGSNFFVLFTQRHQSFARFLLVGGINTIVDLLLYNMLANPLNIYPVVASLISTGLTLCLSYFMNYHFVFKSTAHKRLSALSFVAVTLFNVWVIQSLIIYTSIKTYENFIFFSEHVWTMNLAAKITGISVSMILNYLSYRYIFNKNLEQGEARDKKSEN